jgi:hypothetical protein
VLLAVALAVMVRQALLQDHLSLMQGVAVAVIVSLAIPALVVLAVAVRVV